MTIQLDSFEQQIDPTILKRGFDYFSEGLVTDVDELGHGDYEATVEGSETYTVRLHVEDNVVTDYECDCPYDWGPVCKHVAAVLFYLQKDVFEVEGLPKVPKPRKHPEYVQFEKLLKQLSSEELQSFIRDVCSADKRLRYLFIAKYALRLYPESKELYKNQVQSLVKVYADRYGFLDYQEASRLGRAVHKMVEDAQKCLLSGHKQKALYMSEAIAETLFDTVENADDSNGEIGYCLEETIHLFSEISELDLDDSLHDELFGWLFSQFEKRKMEGWNWHTSLLQIAINLSRTDEETKRIMKGLEQKKSKEVLSEWNYRTLQTFMLQLIRKTEDENAALRFMEENVANPDFRKLLIKNAIQEKEYDRAEQLANDGLDLDAEEHPGLADNWRDYLLCIYQATHKTENEILLTRYFFVNGRDSSLTKLYYEQLKSLIPPTQWPEYRNGLIAEFDKKSYLGRDFDRIAEIYIWEKEWDNLFGLLQKFPTFGHIESVEKYLANDHAEELATMYRNQIINYLPNNIGREHYALVCNYIRRMINLGCEAMASELVEQLRTKYYRRKALLEELDSIF